MTNYPETTPSRLGIVARKNFGFTPKKLNDADEQFKKYALKQDQKDIYAERKYSNYW